MGMLVTEQPFFFQSIHIPIPSESIFRRLGYREGFTHVLKKHQDMVVSYMNDACSRISLKGCALVLPIQEIGQDGVKIRNDLAFDSRSLAKMLDGCHELILMGATAGREIMDEILESTKGSDMTRAIVLDATASEMVDACLDWIVSYMNQTLSRKAKRVTQRRFSAGYGDFKLDNQKVIFERLKLESLGVEITENHVLVPEKSVTAVAGVIGQ